MIWPRVAQSRFGARLLSTNRDPRGGNLEQQHGREVIRPSKQVTKKKKGVRSVGGEDDIVGAAVTITAPSPEPNRAIAFSTAENYDFHKLLPLLQRHYILLPYMADDVFHIKVADPMKVDQKEESSTSSNDSLTTSGGNNSVIADQAVDGSEDGEAFFFNNGTLVTWGVAEEDLQELLRLAAKVAKRPYAEMEMEWFDYVVDQQHPGGVTSETIIIGHDLPASQAKLAFSSGMARSAKLASLENLLDSHLDAHKHIPEALLSGAHPRNLSRASILRSLGELFSLRGRVNHHSELLDPPEFCWSSHRMESFFNQISRNLDVKPRISVFNKKLDYANELAEVMRSHLHEQHSLKLEWAIILLISIEIGFEIVHYLDKWREQAQKEEEKEEERKRLEELLVASFGGSDIRMEKTRRSDGGLDRHDGVEKSSHALSESNMPSSKSGRTLLQRQPLTLSEHDIDGEPTLLDKAARVEDGTESIAAA